LANDLQGWEAQCESQLSRYHTNNLGILLQFANVNYDLIQNKNIKKLRFTFNDNNSVKGLLAMKPGKRPLVIFQTGIYDNAVDGAVVRNYFMNMYDETPFHILVLGSNTGVEYIKDNHILSMGGFEEGKQILDVVQMITNDPAYRDQITDVHVVGVSLGSNAVLYSSLYNSYLPEGASKIKSTMAFCPVVNLQPTMDSVFKYTPRGIFYGILTEQVLREVFSYVPQLANYLNPNYLFWSHEDMKNATSQVALQYYQQKTSQQPWDMQPFSGDTINTQDDIWSHNNFIAQAQRVTTPTLVVYAKDDPLVKPSINSEDLYAHFQNQNSDVGVMAFENGSHCAFNLGESWPTMSTLIRSYVLKHSSYQSDLLREQYAALNNSPRTLTSTQKITKYSFSTSSRNSKIKVNVKYFDRTAQGTDGTFCDGNNILSAPDSCYRSVDFQVNIADYASAGLSIPQNSFQSERLTRWLNTHATLVDSDSNHVLGQNHWPNQIHFHGVYEQPAL
jgi:predicted alpha/beta-fold hydrolase